MKLCMIGTGYVGLVSGTCFADSGNNVICADIDKKKIDFLNSGKVPIYEPGLSEMIAQNVNNKRLSFSTNIEESIKKSDIIFICVGTPSDKKTGEANLKYIFQVAKVIKNNLNKYKIIITKSTVPLTTGDKIEKIISTKKNKNKFDVISNPEFLREGEAIRDFMYPDRVVIGTASKKANSIMKKLYMPIIKKKGRYVNTSRRAAELIKYASNAFLATKISFINEIANLCEKTNVNVQDVSLGMGLDQRIGERFLRAGPGYGGSCFPKDTKALVKTADKFKTNMSIVKSTIKSNDDRTKLLIYRIKQILSKNLNKKKVALLGVTFKANTDDLRDSPALRIIPSLSKLCSNVEYYDPTGPKDIFDKLKNVNFNKSIIDLLKKNDLIIIHTEWNEFKHLNLNLLKNTNKKIFDLRNLYLKSDMIKKKINYYSIGR
ncbi:UDP-glucose/GDP-mannose dehydrogenase family protein [Candidatus Pelagibacter sp.]|nr:UDP-glucose/GDP-mannose dehydrogenase family protein [Candidatus Pelagibacter sp.]